MVMYEHLENMYKYIKKLKITIDDSLLPKIGISHPAEFYELHLNQDSNISSSIMPINRDSIRTLSIATTDSNSRMSVQSIRSSDMYPIAQSIDLCQIKENDESDISDEGERGDVSDTSDISDIDNKNSKINEENDDKLFELSDNDSDYECECELDFDLHFLQPISK
jgi:hypothetical protein